MFVHLSGTRARRRKIRRDSNRRWMKVQGQVMRRQPYRMRPTGSQTFKVMLRLFRFRAATLPLYSLLLSIPLRRAGGHSRIPSPPSRRSTFTTSAPRSASKLPSKRTRGHLCEFQHPNSFKGYPSLPPFQMFNLLPGGVRFQKVAVRPLMPLKRFQRLLIQNFERLSLDLIRAVVFIEKFR
jgi:hypothetical protein